MGRWSRDELEKAFSAYLEAGARASFGGGDRRRQHTPDLPDAAIERQLSQHAHVPDATRLDALLRDEHAERHR